MKIKDLIEQLQELPPNDEICTQGGDDILGDYYYRTNLYITEEVAYKNKQGSLQSSISNYVDIENDVMVKVWVIT